MKIANLNSIVHTILGIVFIILGGLGESEVITIIGFIFLVESLGWQIIGKLEDITDRLDKFEKVEKKEE